MLDQSARFKQAMRRLAGGVAVITVGRDVDVSGFTATSVTSLSADPPCLLVCLNRNSSSWPLVERYGAFAVNLLSDAQTPVARDFAGFGGLKGADRYRASSWRQLVTGTPLLSDAPAAIDCALEKIINHHSHVILIGRVLAVELGAIDAPLVYWQGEFRRLAGLAATEPLLAD